MNKVFIYDDIGPDWAGMVSAKMVSDELRKHTGSPVELHINSPGGSVFEAMAIYNAIATHPGGVHAVIDGVAASAASYVSLAAKTVQIAANGMYMLHPVMGAVRGSIDEIKKYLEMMQLANDQTLAAYQAKSQSNADKIKAMFDAETWLTPQQAMDVGFVTSIGQAFVGEQAKIPKGMYQHAPDSLVAKSDDELLANRMTLRNLSMIGARVVAESLQMRINQLTSQLK